MATRTFSDVPAARERAPILIGLVGPSGTGKTYSALRLATGMQRVTGGDIFVVDTEARRALHYADKFKFRHVAFGAPFSPLDYLSAIEHCLKKGAGTIVVDSTSHEHEGPGGVLEMHESALDKMAGSDAGKRNKLTMLAWAKPKQQRRRLINSILQMECNFIFCFRAKEKMKLQPGKDPIAMGFQGISGDEWIYEMQIKCLLLPGCDGVPTWQSDMPGEKQMVKLPEQFRSMFGKPAQLSEDIGEQIARWAAGTAAPGTRTAAELVADYETCSDPATLRALEDVRRVSWAKLSADEKKRVKATADEARERIERAEVTAAETSDTASEGEAA
jgi:ABC-type dipeptide/oligopeptide/nickel transport system ATPase subunit